MEYSSEIIPEEFEGTMLGDIKLKPLESTGGTSLSYLARMAGKWYFMKRLRPELLADSRSRLMMAKEWAVGRGISHPNIVAYHQFHEDADDCYIMMENVEGATLADKLTQNPTTLLCNGAAGLRRFVEQLLSAVAELHSHQLVHSDLKPSNLMLTNVGGDLKILDLGFAFSSAYIDTTGMTREYAAPEQLAGGPVDGRTDIYAIGRILQYIGQNSGDKRLPSDYRKLMGRCLKESPEERFQSIGEMQEFLRQCHRRRRWLKVGISLAAVFALGIGLYQFSKTDRFEGWYIIVEGLLESHNYDIIADWVHYRIISESDATCEVVGMKRFNPDARIASKVTKDGKEYKVVGIAPRAFFGNVFLNSVYIPEGVKSIGSKAFFYCQNITLLNLPETLEEIDESAFWDCRGVKKIHFGGNRLRKLPRGCFVRACPRQFEVPEGVTSLGTDCFALSENMEEVSLPSTLVTIERGVFYWCTRLKSIAIPVGVNRIDEYAFYQCPRLTDIYIAAEQPPKAVQVSDNPKLRVHVPKTSLSAYQADECWGRFALIGDL